MDLADGSNEGISPSGGGGGSASGAAAINSRSISGYLKSRVTISPSPPNPLSALAEAANKRAESQSGRILLGGEMVTASKFMKKVKALMVDGEVRQAVAICKEAGISQVEFPQQSKVDRATMDMMKAAFDGRAEECHRLVAAGVDVNIMNGAQPGAPLHFAAYKGCIEACRILVEAGASIDSRAARQATPLHMAAEHGHTEVCRMLMEAGAAVDARTDKQLTPLHLAAQAGHTEVCSMLVDAGAVIEAKDSNEFTPLHLAAAMGRVGVYHLLVEAGAAVEATSGKLSTPLHLAARNGHSDVCRRLMEAGAAVDARTDTQQTPLHLAAEHGRTEVCRVLMKAGAAVDARNDQHSTPLHLTAHDGHVEVCCILMEGRAAVDARDEQQSTPLHLAALQGHDSTCILLTFKRADLTALTMANHTPADIAESKGHAALAAHLRSSNGVHCLRCTGPSLKPRLLWNDTTQQQQDAMLDEMQAQWLAKVAEGCAYARAGLTLQGAFGGGLSTGMLVHVMGYVFGGTQAHLQSCISTGRVAAAGSLAMQKANAGGRSKGGPKQESVQHGQDQERLPPRLALVSHALALAATPGPQPVSSGSTTMLSVDARRQLQAALVPLVAAAEAAEGGCEWLCGYCEFLQRRHRVGREEAANENMKFLEEALNKKADGQSGRIFLKGEMVKVKAFLHKVRGLAMNGEVQQALAICREAGISQDSPQSQSQSQSQSQ
jgi:ankyrin repeat protein